MARQLGVRHNTARTGNTHLPCAGTSNGTCPPSYHTGAQQQQQQWLTGALNAFGPGLGSILNQSCCSASSAVMRVEGLKSSMRAMRSKASRGGTTSCGGGGGGGGGTAGRVRVQGRQPEAQGAS